MIIAPERRAIHLPLGTGRAPRLRGKIGAATAKTGVKIVVQMRVRADTMRRMRGAITIERNITLRAGDHLRLAAWVREAGEGPVLIDGDRDRDQGRAAPPDLGAKPVRAIACQRRSAQCADEQPLSPACPKAAANPTRDDLC